MAKHQPGLKQSRPSVTVPSTAGPRAQRGREESLRCRREEGAHFSCCKLSLRSLCVCGPVSSPDVG